MHVNKSLDQIKIVYINVFYLTKAMSPNAADAAFPSNGTDDTENSKG